VDLIIEKQKHEKEVKEYWICIYTSRKLSILKWIQRKITLLLCHFCPIDIYIV